MRSMGVVDAQKVPSTENFQVPEARMAVFQDIGQFEGRVVLAHQGFGHGLGEQFLVGQDVVGIDGRPTAGRQLAQFPFEQLGDFLGLFFVVSAKSLESPVDPRGRLPRGHVEKGERFLELRVEVTFFHLPGDLGMVPVEGVGVYLHQCEIVLGAVEGYLASAVGRIGEMRTRRVGRCELELAHKRLHPHQRMPVIGPGAGDPGDAGLFNSGDPVAAADVLAADTDDDQRELVANLFDIFNVGMRFLVKGKVCTLCGVHRKHKEAVRNPGNFDSVGIEERNAHGDGLGVAMGFQKGFVSFGTNEIVDVFILRLGELFRLIGFKPPPSVQPCRPTKQRLWQAKQV
ncbi:hypothetical protein [Solidesulfovibrio magneticus]|uniref:hypothetical protein n=1 Tax=Solidesulfovibrio magneticus TaxID=184917 RepID=UPI001E4AE388|nr:hypothetical protein [Solidesulfovibrio magneticus]